MHIQHGIIVQCGITQSPDVIRKTVLAFLCLVIHANARKEVLQLIILAVVSKPATPQLQFSDERIVCMSRVMLGVERVLTINEQYNIVIYYKAMD